MICYDAAIIGAGPAGLLCARNAARAQLRVALIDSHEDPGAKLSLAGGGRGNITNRIIAENRYVSEHPERVRAVLRLFPCEKALDIMRELSLPFEERDFGQIFGLRPACLVAERLAMQCDDAGVDFYLGRTAREIAPPSSSQNPAFGRSREKSGLFSLMAGNEPVTARRLVVATGSPAFPAVGAGAAVAKSAERWGHRLIPFRAVLTPFVMPQHWPLAGLEGISLNVRITILRDGQELWTDPEGIRPMLFTHRGISGPAALVASCRWREGDELRIDFLPELPVMELLDAREYGKMLARNILARRDRPPQGRGTFPQRQAAPCGGGARLPHRSRGNGRIEEGGSRCGRNLVLLPFPPHGKPCRARALLLRRGGGCRRASGRLQHTLGLRLGRAGGRGAEGKPERLRCCAQRKASPRSAPPAGRPGLPAGEEGVHGPFPQETGKYHGFPLLPALKNRSQA